MNLLTDPGFRTLGQDESPWMIKTHEGTHVEAGALGGVVTLKTKWTKGTNWHVELIYGPFAVRAGQRLGLAFEACALNPFRFSAWLGQYDEPFDALVGENNHFGEETMPRQWGRFQHLWKVEQDEDKARLDFVLGRIDTTIRLRNLRLVLLDGR